MNMFDKNQYNEILVGGFNPFENVRQIWSSSQVGVRNKNVWNHHLESAFEASQSI